MNAGAMERDAKIFVAGHRGLLGSAVTRKLQSDGYNGLILKNRSELDLFDQRAVFEFFERERPEYVFLCAAKVGGIKANWEHLGQFCYENLVIQNNVIEGSRRSGVKKLLFVASTCIYPTNVPNPITEEQILAGPLEPTNEGYAVAKVAGVKLCQFYRKQYGCSFISAIPCNLFGKNDHYDANNSHVLQSLIRKVHLARAEGKKSIEIWGSGKPRREFMLSDDCADALVFLMNSYDGELPLNVGTGVDHSIVELAQNVCDALDYPVDFSHDRSKPDGMFQKLSDVSRIRALGWQPKTSLRDGIKVAYEDFLRQTDGTA